MWISRKDYMKLLERNAETQESLAIYKRDCERFIEVIRDLRKDIRNRQEAEAKAAAEARHAKLPKYNPDTACPKCYSLIHDLAYDAGDAAMPILVVKCGCCGYRWNMKPLDAE